MAARTRTRPRFAGTRRSGSSRSVGRLLGRRSRAVAVHFSSDAPRGATTSSLSPSLCPSLHPSLPLSTPLSPSLPLSLSLRLSLSSSLSLSLSHFRRVERLRECGGAPSFASRRCDLSRENFDPNEHKGGEGGAPLTSFDELRALLKDNGADNGATPQIIDLVAKRTVTRRTETASS